MIYIHPGDTTEKQVDIQIVSTGDYLFFYYDKEGNKLRCESWSKGSAMDMICILVILGYFQIK